MIDPKNIYEYVISEEHAYTVPVTVIDGYDWNMKEHIRLSTLYKNSVFSTGKDDEKPFKNITKPILDLQHHATDFDVKDIELYITDLKQFYKSFLVKKYHEKWARENKLDTFIDNLVESYCDYGGALIKKGKKDIPEVVPLQSLAFCDQTDILSGALAIKHFMSPDQLRDMEDLGWGDEKNNATATIEEVIVLAKSEKRIDNQSSKKTETPGKYIEVYEVHGTFPQSFLGGESERYSTQLHIICFYTNRNSEKEWITLYAGKQKELPFKFIARDEIYNRALGLGGAEELFEPQVWINYDMIRLKQLLDGAAKVIYKTTDPNVAARNKIYDMENEEVVVLAEGTDIGQLDTTPRNIAIFNKAVDDWMAHAQQIGSANDALLGVPPTAGTPFKLQELVTQTGSSLHNHRRGKLATFLEEVYRDWILPKIVKEIMKGEQFIADLDFEELQLVANAVVDTKVNNFVKNRILDGELIAKEEVEDERKKAREQFMKGGKKRFIEILKDELKEAAMDIKINIAGKQEDLSQKVDKLVNIFRQIISAPQVLAQPQMADLFNQILEASGLSPIDFGSMRYELTQQGEQSTQQLGQSTQLPPQLGQGLTQMQSTMA